MTKDKLIFTMEDLPMLRSKNNPTCYGLFQSTECYSAYSIGTATLSFNFLHLGLQEYFAARYIARSSDKLLMKTLDSIFEEDYCHAEIIMDKHTDAGVQHTVVSRHSLNTDVLSHTSATMDYDMDFLGTSNAIVRIHFSMC